MFEFGCHHLHHSQLCYMQAEHILCPMDAFSIYFYMEVSGRETIIFSTSQISCCSHFVETQHTYSMQLGNNRVWDYAGDNYVHRLVQNKGDGKLVEVDEGGRVVHEEKVDSLALEVNLK